MHPADPVIRDYLAAALRNDPQPWPASWHDPDTIADAAIFHGIAGLLIEQEPSIREWPSQLKDRLYEQARAQAMWEVRHRQLLTDLLAIFHRRSIPCLIMKGTAVAYDLYKNPASRSRSDTDLLVAPEDAEKARTVLAEFGYVAGALGGVTPEFALQQAWNMKLADGGRHTIDLHWQVMNAPSLRHLLSFAECDATSRQVPRLASQARTMDRVRLLIHTCLHRAMQWNAPFFVGGRTFFEPGRLIWSMDIHLLASALEKEEWPALCSLSRAMGVSRPCLESLEAARASLGTEIDESARHSLYEVARAERPSAYFFRSHALSRAWQDVRSMAKWSTRLRYMLSRVVTTEPFIRGKYPHLADKPLVILYGRRIRDLVRRRPDAS